ncbi:hypothetical protein [Thermomonas fusca]
MIAAKDYYYTVLAPEEAGRNYQQVHQSHLYGDSCDVITHLPKLSNDILIEDYLVELMDQASAEISRTLETFFIAKRRNYFANAGALHHQGQHQGRIIFFHVGLSDLLFQYAILFTDFFRLIEARKSEESGSDEVKYWLHRVLSNAAKLRDAQIDWGINRNEIRFKETTLVEPHEDTGQRAATVATHMDKAVLRHEIAHHLLGHTSSDRDPFLINSAISPFFDSIDVPAQHRRELEADLASVYLPASAGELVKDKQASFEISLGTSLCQTVLSHLKYNIRVDSESHPSWETRHRLTNVALQTFSQPNACMAALSMVSRFQAFLYLTQDRGLGELTLNEWLSGGGPDAAA